ncbi:MAG: prolyl oligopeptidase, partial [bacterium]
MRRMNFLWLPALAVLFVTGMARSTQPSGTNDQASGPRSTLTYPVTFRGAVADTFFDVTVPDPYRWLETDVRNSDSVSNWVEEEDGLTRGYLAALPGRDAIGKELTDLWNYEKTSAPRRAGRPRTLLDPNTLSADGTTALAGWAVSDDGRWLAWGVSVGGTDWQEWRVRDVATGVDQPGVTEWMRYTAVSWHPDNSGYYYSRYDRPVEGTAYTGRNLFHKVCFHQVGTEQAADRLVYERKDQSEWLLNANPTEDGQWLVLTASTGGQKNRIFVQDLVRTDDEASRGRLIAIDVTRPGRENWKTIVPEGEESLRGASFAGDQIYLSYLKDASSEVRVIDRSGAPVRTVALPGIGTASGFGARRDDTESFYTFASFTRPPTTYRVDLSTGASRIWRETHVAFDPEAYEVHREFITSEDGTRVPVFLAHRKGIALDGRNPTLLYVYGGFNQPQVPSFSI